MLARPNTERASWKQLVTMPSGDFVKALIKAHADADEPRFYAVAHQLAAHEARLGHARLASQLKSLVQELRSAPGPRRQPSPSPAVFHAIPELLRPFIFVEYPSNRFSHYFGTALNRGVLNRLIAETTNRTLLSNHGLKPAGRVLFVGAPGTGKTTAARVLASESGVPLFRVSVAQLATLDESQFMAIVDWLFAAEQIRSTRSVVLYEDWGGDGSAHGFGVKVGTSRVCTTIRRYLRDDDSLNVYVAESDIDSNEPLGSLASVFDLVVRFDYLDPQDAVRVIRARLAHISVVGVDWAELQAELPRLSIGQIVAIADGVAKLSTVNGEPVTHSDLVLMIESLRGD